MMRYLISILLALLITACSANDNDYDNFIGFWVEGTPQFRSVATRANIVEINKQGDSFFINENYVYGDGNTIPMKKLTESQDLINGLSYNSEMLLGISNRVKFHDDEGYSSIGIFNTVFYRISKEEAEQIKNAVEECDEIEKNRFFIPKEQNEKYKQRAKELPYCRIFW